MQFTDARELFFLLRGLTGPAAADPPATEAAAEAGADGSLAAVFAVSSSLGSSKSDMIW